MEIYARIVDGAVVEYPVLPVHIVTRGHPTSWYTQVVFDTKPTVPDFHITAESMKLVDGVPHVSYTVEPVSLEILFTMVPRSGDDLLPGEVAADYPLDPALVARIQKLVIDRVQARLDAFAAERGYGDSKTSPMVAVASYALSGNARYAAEAAYCIKLRDETWAAVEVIMTEITTGVITVPRGYNEILAKLPVPAWPDATTSEV